MLLSDGVKLTCSRQESYLSTRTDKERRHISAGLEHKAERPSHSSLLRNEPVLSDFARDGERRARELGVVGEKWGVQDGEGLERKCVPESLVPIC